MNNEIIDIIKSCIEETITGNDISVKKSIKEKDNNKKNIYNEFSLQHELGIKLRSKLKEKNKSNYLVQFERNITSFNEKLKKKYDIKDIFKKSEIDIVIVNVNNNEEKYAIELKYHKKNDGRIPNTIYDCVKDMYFANALVSKLDFCHAFCVTISEDKMFYSNEEKVTKRRKLQNYMYFEKDISKEKIGIKMKEYESDSEDEITNPMNIVYLNKSPLTLSIKDFYKNNIVPVKWIPIDKEDSEKGAYYIIEISNG